MRLNALIRALIGAGIVFLLSGCATIVNDANIPLTFSFSDGSGGDCTFKNKRGTWESAIPTSGVYIRRSDDALIYDCKTRDGREATGSVRSEMEGGKLAASVLLWDFGITDSITDKHRTYQGNVVIPVAPKDEVTPDSLTQTTETVGVDKEISSEAEASDVSDSTGQDTFRVKCPGCGHVVSYKAKDAGTTIKCTQCGNEVNLL